MKSTSVCRSSLLALSLAATLAPSGCGSLDDLPPTEDVGRAVSAAVNYADVNVLYWGGPVIENIDVIPVYWSPNVQYQSNLNAFYKAIVTGSEMSFLGEYNVPSQENGTPPQTIGNGTLGTPYVDPSNPPDLIAVIGATTVGGRPYAFTRDSAGDLFSNYWDYSYWSWGNQGMPNPSANPPVTVAQGVGVTIANDNPYVFVLGSDGHLWQNYWNGSSWVWFDANKPDDDSVSLNLPVGVTTVGGRPYAFIFDEDYNLWQNYWTGSSWVWYNAGKPNSNAYITRPVGITTLDGNPCVLGLDGYGHLWMNWWSGSSWMWLDWGEPNGGVVFTSPVGVTTVNGNPYVFILDSDANLWSSSPGEGWHNGGKPNSSVTLNRPVGVAAVNGIPYAFIRDSDGNLWQNLWQGSSGVWYNGGRPGDTYINGSGGITVAGDGPFAKPYVFIQGNDGHLWLNSYDNSNWQWSNQNDVTDAMVQVHLTWLFDNGLLPAPTNNSYYPVHFPPGVTITASDGSQSCVDFGGYHSSFQYAGQNVYYGVLPDLSPPACNGDPSKGFGCDPNAGDCGSVLADTTTAASHEFAETVTDPYAPNPAWDDAEYGEIGDICNGQQVTVTLGDGNNYTVQQLWSLLCNACKPPNSHDPCL